MRAMTISMLCAGLLLSFSSARLSAAPVCNGASFGKTCMKCDTGACLDSTTKKIGACTPARCGEAAKPFKPPARDENTGY